MEQYYVVIRQLVVSKQQQKNNNIPRVYAVHAHCIRSKVDADDEENNEKKVAVMRKFTETLAPSMYHVCTLQSANCVFLVVVVSKV